MLDIQSVLLNQELATSERNLIGYFKNVGKFYLNCLIVVVISMILKCLLIEVKALLEIKLCI